MKKIKISILGSTGSIGTTTLNIIKKKYSHFQVNILSANKNYSKIIQIIKKFKPKIFIINNYKIYKKIKKKYSKNKKLKIYNNFDFSNVEKRKNDITVSSISGIAGLSPTLIFTKNSKKLLIANKESIICGWNLIKKKSKKNKTELIPIDSEHYSILSLIKNHKHDEIKKIFITASGGPFLKLNFSKFKNITPKDALRHPKWKMGKKVSIDSATLMNKILELDEAQKLFNFNKDKLDILIHPESLVHAIVQLKNGITKFITINLTNESKPKELKSLKFTWPSCFSSGIKNFGFAIQLIVSKLATKKIIKIKPKEINNFLNSLLNMSQKESKMNPLSLLRTAIKQIIENKMIFLFLLAYKAANAKNISKIENEYSPK